MNYSDTWRICLLSMGVIASRYIRMYVRMFHFLFLELGSGTDYSELPSLTAVTFIIRWDTFYTLHMHEYMHTHTHTHTHCHLHSTYSSSTDSGGLLIHCISGWDRTPLFISLLRLSLWAVSPLSFRHTLYVLQFMHIYLCTYVCMYIHMYLSMYIYIYIDTVVRLFPYILY